MFCIIRAGASKGSNQALIQQNIYETWYFNFIHFVSAHADVLGYQSSNPG